MLHRKMILTQTHVCVCVCECVLHYKERSDEEGEMEGGKISRKERKRISPNGASDLRKHARVSSAFIIFLSLLCPSVPLHQLHLLLLLLLHFPLSPSLQLCPLLPTHLHPRCHPTDPADLTLTLPKPVDTPSVPDCSWEPVSRKHTHTHTVNAARTYRNLALAEKIKT